MSWQTLEDGGAPVFSPQRAAVTVLPAADKLPENFYSLTALWGLTATSVTLSELDRRDGRLTVGVPVRVPSRSDTSRTSTSTIWAVGLGARAMLPLKMPCALRCLKRLSSSAGTDVWPVISAFISTKITTNNAITMTTTANAIANAASVNLSTTLSRDCKKPDKSNSVKK